MDYSVGYRLNHEVQWKPIDFERKSIENRQKVNVSRLIANTKLVGMYVVGQHRMSAQEPPKYSLRTFIFGHTYTL